MVSSGLQGISSRTHFSRNMMRPSPATVFPVDPFWLDRQGYGPQIQILPYNKEKDRL